MGSVAGNGRVVVVLLARGCGDNIGSKVDFDVICLTDFLFYKINTIKIFIRSKSTSFIWFFLTNTLTKIIKENKYLLIHLKY